MNDQGNAGPLDVVLNEAHVLTAEPGGEHVLYRETRRAELVRRKHETKRKH